MSDKKCCICFPLECGVTLIACLTILGCILDVLSFTSEEGSIELYWPDMIFVGTMSTIWLVALICPSEQTRKIAYYGWVILICICVSAFYIYLLLSGNLTKQWCKNMTVGVVDLNKGEQSMSREECE